ncbi:MAG: biotin--[acetyl-CoA-carboxylase] ligase [Actinobacteria bacterium]|nr:biotin--[acetyl-CoA-carboxylase] ligase [Actinomycetota bacterium]MCL5446111.1 biotin--[acetyl-CoA-carboxylase] ligase [Actinomycetota bacterium]
MDSTNDYLVRLLKSDLQGAGGISDSAGSEDGLVVVADYQSQGKGRLGREWLAPPGRCLLASLVVTVRAGTQFMHLAPSMAGLAVFRACLDTAGIRVDLAWPNDLYVAGRKLAGVLAEVVGVPAPAAPCTAPVAAPYTAGKQSMGVSRRLVQGEPDDGAGVEVASYANPPVDIHSGAPGPARVVVGIGLNVSWPAMAAGSEISGATGNIATSLLLEAGRLIDRRVLLERILVWFDGYLAQATSSNWLRIAQEYRERCVTVGSQVEVSMMTGSVLAGTAVDIDEQGRLVVGVNGRREAISAGDVRILRQQEMTC